jgi:hypothetical protein
MTTIDFVAPWHAVRDASKYEAELERELGPEHRLYAKPLRAIAFHDACDDVLFADAEGGVHVVHLTWIGRREPDPRWPMTTTYRSLQDFAERGMTED